MIVLTNNDYLEVKLNSLIADYDKDTLVNLYQPIIGYEAVALYLTLWCEANNQKIASIISHGQLIDRMKISTGKFVDARKKLEGVGLVKTFISSLGEQTLYHYELYAPKAPWDFFNNALLYGMLIKETSKADALRIKNIYLLNNKEEKGKEISATFMEVYHPDFEDPSFNKALENDGKSIGRRTAKVTSEFSYELFYQELSKISQIQSGSFSKKEIKEIERLATLNGINEASAASDVAEIYEKEAASGHKIDFDKLAKMFQDETNYNYISSRKKATSSNLVEGNTDLANKINFMEKTSPKDYLAVLQNGTKPAPSDLRLINDLSSDYHLANPVINAVIDFVLYMNNNVLSRPYAEKVAASLAREGIETTIDAMNYLRKTSKKTVNKGSTIEEKTKIVDNTTTAEKVDDLDWDKLMSDIDEVNGNGEN